MNPGGIENLYASSGSCGGDNGFCPHGCSSTWIPFNSWLQQFQQDPEFKVECTGTATYQFE